jgi:phosphoribosylanthranilate isomerase
VLDYLEACRTLDCLPRLILFDAPLTRGFGGSGKLAEWSLAKRYLEKHKSPALVLAGGLKSDNVAEAIRMTGAAAVDTASGVELQPGIKDPAAIAAFVRAARAAWGA